MEVGIIDAFSRIPFHLDFLDDENFLVNVTFTGALGTAVGIILAMIAIEIKNIIND